MEEDNIVLAKDIEDCDSCPLKDHDCPGGWTSGGSGQLGTRATITLRTKSV